MDKSKNKIIFILSVFSIVVSMTLLLFCWFLADRAETKLEMGGSLTTIKSCEMNGRLYRMPFHFNCIADQPVEMTITLPQTIPEGYAMAMYALHSRIDIIVGDKLIGTYGDDARFIWGRLTGNIRYIVDLDPSMAGAKMKIVITSYHTQGSDFASPSFGYKGDIKNQIIADNFLRFTICVIMMTICILSTVIAIFRKGRSEINTKLIAYFAMFVFLVTAWIVCSSDMPQFFTNNNSAVALTSYYILSIIAIPYEGFCRELLPKKWKVFYWMQIVNWMIPVINIIGMVTKLFAPPEVLILSHICIIASAGYSLFCALKEWKSGTDAKLLAISLVIMTLSVSAGLVCYFVAPSRGYSAVLFGFGLLVFIVLIFSLIIYKQVKLVEDRKYLEVYKELAFSDIMTGLGNRAGFEKEFARIGEHNEEGVWVTLFMFDMNDLKKINDQYGHQSGDKVIVGFSDCLKKVFGRFGNIYRLGGDEFAAVALNQKGWAETLLMNLDEEIENYNALNEHPINTAKGYAELQWTKDESFMQLIFRLADQDMYMDKQRKHHSLDASAN